MTKTVIESNASSDLHHVVSINADMSRRMDSRNWLAVCRACHNELEGNELEGMTVKQWSQEHYETKLNEGLS